MPTLRQIFGLKIKKREWDEKDFNKWLQNPKLYDETYVVKLLLSNIRSHEILSSIDKLINLEQLFASYNYLRELPIEVCNLRKLKVLQLDHNNLRHLPNEIGNLENLQTLTLERNHLTNLPNEIGNLQNLKWLNLRINYIQTLPESIYNLPNLEYFDLVGNHHLVLNINRFRQIRGYNNRSFLLPNSARDEAEVREERMQERREVIAPPQAGQRRRGFAVEIHDAFAKLDLNALYNLVNSKLGGQPVYPDDMIEYINDSVQIFINNIKDETDRINISNKFNSIMNRLLRGIDYYNKKNNYKQYVVYAIEYVKLQPPLFQEEYMRYFTQDCIGAYNGSGSLTCAKGGIERFVFSIEGAFAALESSLNANSRLNEPTISNNTKQNLLKNKNSIIKIYHPPNKSMMDVFKQYGNVCAISSKSDENEFRNCIKDKFKENAKPVPSTEEMDAFLNEQIPTLGIFGGGSRKYKIKTRKRSATYKKKTQKKINKKSQKRKTRKH